MNDMSCPWCECSLELSMDQSDEQQCLQCLTTWRYEDEEAVEIALAA